MAGVKVEGLDELRRALRQLPEDLTNEAEAIVIAHAEAAQHDVQSGYPVRETGLRPGPKRVRPWYPPGSLKGRVIAQRNKSKMAVSVVVRSVAPHSHLFEDGTVARQNKKGANRGRMPKANEAQRMIPKIIRWRKKMTDALIELVRSAGFEVSA